MVKMGDTVNGFMILQIQTHFDLTQKRRFVYARCSEGHIIYRRLDALRKIRRCLECRKESGDYNAGNRNPHDPLPEKVYVRTRIQTYGYDKGVVKRWLVVKPAPGDAEYVLQTEKIDDTRRSCEKSMGNVRDIHQGNG